MHKAPIIATMLIAFVSCLPLWMLDTPPQMMGSESEWAIVVGAVTASSVCLIVIGAVAIFHWGRR